MLDLWKGGWDEEGEREEKGPVLFMVSEKVW